LSHNLNETIDQSVISRRQTDPDYRPENLSIWAEEASLDFDTLSLDGADHLVVRHRDSSPT
jgi:hypothetical protein